MLERRQESLDWRCEGVSCLLTAWLQSSWRSCANGQGQRIWEALRANSHIGAAVPCCSSGLPKLGTFPLSGGTDVIESGHAQFISWWILYLAPNRTFAQTMALGNEISLNKVYIYVCECGHMHVTACTGRTHTNQLSEVASPLPLWVLGIKLGLSDLEGQFLYPWSHLSGLRNELPPL